MIKLVMKHTTCAREKITERVFSTLQAARNYKNAVVRKMCKGRKWVLVRRNAEQELWNTTSGTSAVKFDLTDV